jgi:murein DD-endopeptidase MepM/ murein hydrolase activator NlpD
MNGEYHNDYENDYEPAQEPVVEPEKRRPKLLEKAVICLIAALLVWGLTASRLPFLQRLGHYLSVALNTDFGTDLEQWGRSLLQPLKDGSLADTVEDWGLHSRTAVRASAEVWPIDGPVTASGQRTWTEENGAHTLAQGITIAATSGVAVQAVAPGIVASVLPTTQGSYQIIIKHLGDWQSLYQGINVVYVQKDDAVTAAQQIGYLAQNGGLGFAIKIAQSYVDPLSVLPKRPVSAQ